MSHLRTFGVQDRFKTESQEKLDKVHSVRETTTSLKIAVKHNSAAVLHHSSRVLYLHCVSKNGHPFYFFHNSLK